MREEFHYGDRFATQRFRASTANKYSYTHKHAYIHIVEVITFATERGKVYRCRVGARSQN